MRLLRRRQAPPLPRRRSTYPAVSCERLSKRFGEIVAVDDVTLEVPRGEILALLGPSGCGKTTFLRLIAGFERPDAGTIALGGRSVSQNGTHLAPEKRHVGVVFQDYALFPHLCVGDNVAFGVKGDEDCDTRVRDVLHLVGLTGQGDRFPHELSGGQQQRVAIARALAPRPDLVLLDEPFSNLDASLRQQIRTEVREILRRAGATAIFVTHDQEEALSLADRVAIMAEGKIHQVATPEVIYTRPDDLFVANFVGGANIIGGMSDGHDVASPLGSIRPLNTPPRGPVMLVVRPESLRLHAEATGEAVVLGSTYYGHDQTVSVRLRDGEAVDVRTATARFFELGDRVTVTVVPDEVLAFPATP
jgi:iron(III) transport system ATP-binding protein